MKVNEALDRIFRQLVVLTEQVADIHATVVPFGHEPQPDSTESEDDSTEPAE